MIIQRGLIRVLLVDQYRTGVSFDKVRNVTDAASFFARGARQKAEDRNDLVMIVLLEGHPYRKAQHSRLPFLLGFQRFIKRRQRHGLIAVGAGRDHSNLCARFLLNKVQIMDWTRSGAPNELVEQEFSFKAFYNATDGKMSTLIITNMTTAL